MKRLTNHEKMRADALSDLIFLGIEDLPRAGIYLSVWINHCSIGFYCYSGVSLSQAILACKMVVTVEHPGMRSFWTPIMPGMEPYFYAGEQEKWVWMRRVSINEPIPFVHRTCGVTRKLTLHGTTVYWRMPKSKNDRRS